MAYIAPNSIIKLLRNVRLEPDYNNTIYFSSLSAQTNFFSGKTKYTLNNQSYQRANKGVCRVNFKVEDLYDCNYMMFQNTSFGSKWFYAFITSVDYVNNVTSDIHYEIDVMQTWLKDMTFSMCFVEREHSGSDAIGDNIIPEPLELGEMVFNNYEKLTDDLDNLVIGVLICDTDNPNGNTIDGIFSGAILHAYGNTMNGTTNLRAFLRTYSPRPDAIVAMYMLPAKAVGNYTQTEFDNGVTTPFSAVCSNFDYANNTWILSGNETIDGHIVRNKKLFTYPYNFFHIDNANGRELNLRYEFFTDQNGNRNYSPQIKMFANMCMPVTVVARPKNYKGIKNNDYSRAESIDLTNFPMCSWNMDYWTAWVAQNSVAEALSAAKGALGVGAGVASTLVASSLGLAGATVATVLAPATVAIGAFAITSGVMQDAYSASIHADIMKGSLNNGNINVASNNHKFFCGRVSINRQVAKIIDDFFDKFGYATKEVKVPNIHSRNAWNYVKTIGSNVDGNIPGDDKRIIDANFDKGITFWHDGDRVDDYSQNNDPVSP